MSLIGTVRPKVLCSLGAMAAIGGLMVAASAQAQEREQNLLNDAQATLVDFKNDEEFPGFESQLAKAKAVLVVPSLTKASFIVGGEGGSGVLLARDGSEVGWSYPAFYKVTAGSVGLQIGAQEAETVFMIMTEEGLRKLMSDEHKLGVDAGAAVVDAGSGVEGSTTTNLGGDIVAYARSEGLYLGASFEGAVVSPDEAANQAYYGANATPEAILADAGVQNAAADPLRAVLKGS
ncbi:MAG: lipid-binding SYLF domain-containing protein [Alphaproteobacteria bacterium]